MSAITPEAYSALIINAVEDALKHIFVSTAVFVKDQVAPDLNSNPNAYAEYLTYPQLVVVMAKKSGDKLGDEFTYTQRKTKADGIGAKVEFEASQMKKVFCNPGTEAKQVLVYMLIKFVSELRQYFASKGNVFPTNCNIQVLSEYADSEIPDSIITPIAELLNIYDVNKFTQITIVDNEGKASIQQVITTEYCDLLYTHIKAYFASTQDIGAILKPLLINFIQFVQIIANICTNMQMIKQTVISEQVIQTTLLVLNTVLGKSGVKIPLALFDEIKEFRTAIAIAKPKTKAKGKATTTDIAKAVNDELTADINGTATNNIDL